METNIVYKYANENSKNKERYIEFTCECGEEVSKRYRKGMALKCNKCVRESKRPLQYYVDKSKGRFEDLLDYSEAKVETKGKYKFFTVKCKKHGNFTQRFTDHMVSKLHTGGCKKCAVRQETHPKLNKKITTSIESWKKLLDNKFKKLSIVSYENTRKIDSVVLKCEEHGEFTTKFDSLRKGKYLCPKCVAKYNPRASKLEYSDIKYWSKLLESKTSLITIDSYNKVGRTEPVTLSCKLHGNFVKDFASISRGDIICPTCVKSTPTLNGVRENLKGTDTILYYVYLPRIDMYKLGTTIQPIASRQTEVFEEIFSTTLEYEKARLLEHKIHTELSDYRYNGTHKLIKEGTYELYKINILNEIKQYLRDSQE